MVVSNNFGGPKKKHQIKKYSLILNSIKKTQNISGQFKVI